MTTGARTDGRYRIGDRTVRLKFFEYPGRGFQPWEIGQIAALAVGESLTIREYTIQREPNARHEGANAVGFIVGSFMAAGELAWLSRSALHALSAHDWIYGSATWIVRALDMVLAKSLGVAFDQPPAFAWVIPAALLICLSLSVAITLAGLIGEYVAQATEVILKGESPWSTTSAMVDLCAPVFAVSVFLACRESDIDLATSLVAASAIFVAGLSAIRVARQRDRK